MLEFNLKNSIVTGYSEDELMLYRDDAIPINYKLSYCLLRTKKPSETNENLENIIFEGEIGKEIDIQHSHKLTKASITSIINALSSTTSGLSVTLSKTAVNTAFETSTGANNGSISTEWSALVATKTNWTINLV